MKIYAENAKQKLEELQRKKADYAQEKNVFLKFQSQESFSDLEDYRIQIKTQEFEIEKLKAELYAKEKTIKIQNEQIKVLDQNRRKKTIQANLNSRQKQNPLENRHQEDSFNNKKINKTVTEISENGPKQSKGQPRYEHENKENLITQSNNEPYLVHKTEGDYKYYVINNQNQPENVIKLQ